MVYVDNDPVVRAHGRALLKEDEQTIFSDEVVRGHLDFSEPIAPFQLGTLHHYDGARSRRSIMAEYVDALPAGSYVAISHFCDPQTRPELSLLARKI